MSSGKKPRVWDKVKKAVGIKSNKCVCREINPGQWCCTQLDGGKVVSCFGAKKYGSKAECEAAGCDDD